MGIQDRDYYRNEGPSIFDSLMPTGLVCRWLIGINVAMFFLQLVSLSVVAYDPEGKQPIVPTLGFVTDWLVLDVAAVSHGQVWRLLTFAFLHSPGDWFHILFNMLFLWWFGSEIEELYGRKEFLAIYLVSATLGGVVFWLWGLTQVVNMHCLGASGAVTTMLVLCALHFPRRIIYVFFVLPMPIALFAVFNVLRDAAGFMGWGGPGVAFSVHLAGAGFALLYYKWQHRLIDLLGGFPWLKLPRSRPRLKLYDPDADTHEPVAVSANSAPANSMDEHLEAKLDALLEKIAKSGKDSLTPKEQEILKQASEMYKRRRT